MPPLVVLVTVSHFTAVSHDSELQQLTYRAIQLCRGCGRIRHRSCLYNVRGVIGVARNDPRDTLCREPLYSLLLNNHLCSKQLSKRGLTSI
jgi:hypothetical protein